MIAIPPYEYPKWYSKYRWALDLAQSVPLNGGIYFLFDANKTLIYIGQTCQIRSRIIDHLFSKPQVRFVSWKITDNTNHFESLLIRRYHPMLNSSIPKRVFPKICQEAEEKLKPYFQPRYLYPWERDPKRAEERSRELINLLGKHWQTVEWVDKE